MALQKEIELPNGVKVNYHRVVSINSFVNVQTTIEVASYISRDKREDEISFYSDDGSGSTDVYIDTRYMVAEYTDGMDAEQAYGWLKQQPDFEGSVDV